MQPNSDDYKIQAEHHDREVAAMKAKIDLAKSSLDKERSRIEKDIAAAKAQMERLAPFKNDNVDHSVEYTSWENNLTTLQGELQRAIPPMEAKLAEHIKAHDDHKVEAEKAWTAHKAAKTAEQQEQVRRMATRAQDPNQGSSSDYDLAA